VAAVALAAAVLPEALVLAAPLVLAEPSVAPAAELLPWLAAVLPLSSSPRFQWPWRPRWTEPL